MVKIWSISIYRKINDKIIRLGITSDVSSFNFFIKNSMADMFAFISRSVVENKNKTQDTEENKTEENKHHVIQLDKYPYYLHFLPSINNLFVVMITDLDYPPRIGVTAVKKISDMYNNFSNCLDNSILGNNIQWEEAKLFNNLGKNNSQDLNSSHINLWLEGLLKKYNNPQDVDIMEKIKQQLEETKEHMVINIEKIIQRGEDLDVLIDKSKDLSDTSKRYLKEAKKMNRCCRYY
jgi:synaptobrevin family protein YKT6